MTAFVDVYVPDTIVVDVPAEIVAADDEELMQIRLHTDDVWHRYAVGGRVTACGVPIRPSPAVQWMHGFEIREGAYAGELCPECFTPYERTLAADRNRKPED